MEDLVVNPCSVCGHPTLAIVPQGTQLSGVICKGCACEKLKDKKPKFSDDHVAEVIPMFGTKR